MQHHIGLFPISLPSPPSTIPSRLRVQVTVETDQHTATPPSSRSRLPNASTIDDMYDNQDEDVLTTLRGMRM